MNSVFDIRDLLMGLCKLICQVLDAQYCLILLVDPQKKYSLFRCVVSKRKKYLIDRKFRIINSIEKKIIKSVSSIRNDGLMGAPLIAEDLIGLILIRRNRKQPFNIDDEKILMILAEQSVMGIRNIQLYEEQEKIVLGSIKSLVTLLDMRVPQEYTHSPYFNCLVMAIAQQMQLDEKQIQSLQYASMLHDAGKVDIPPEILTKTTKLTPREIKIIKHHPIKGAQILKHLQILRPVIPIILHHHEKYNGTGYPSKLKKGQIPLGARIMAVADAFEAMVYGRPYRERITVAQAIKEIGRKSGSQFDPNVVEAFFKIVNPANLALKEKGRITENIKGFEIKKYLQLLK
jgi:HD-GYP domain-containing protein (c-di-GMP phosphodiesterase class II)